MSNEERALSDIVAAIIERRHDQTRISAAWIATEAMKELDADRIAPPLVFLGCHLELRQIARSLLRGTFEGDSEPGAQHNLFPELQRRYPVARSRGDEAVYVLLEDLTKADVKYNVNRLLSEADSKIKHARALEAWDAKRRRRA